MNYYISDLHFFHTNIISIDEREFEDFTHMNEYMISQWNSRVRNCDNVFILGDFSVGTPTETSNVLKKLNGTKYLITGNHDDYIFDKVFDRKLFGWIKPYKELKDGNRKVVLSHYPIICYNGQNRIDRDGNPITYMLYGHVHNAYEEMLITKFIGDVRATKKTDFNGEMKNIPCNIINCFCMYADYIPRTLEEWIEIDKNRRGLRNVY